MFGAGLEAGKAYVDLVPRLQAGFGNAVEKEMSGPLARIAASARGLGVAVATGIGLGAVAGAGALLAAGLTIDDALDKIRIGTGKTGDELAGLEQIFRNVAAQVPDSMGTVADAITQLSQRTGQTGPDLEALATQILTLSRITGEDLGSTIENSTRLFGDWGVAIEDQAGTLDFLFSVSQQTGIGIGQLETSLVKFGAPLRQLGFGFEESAALIGKFEQEGVNAELVLGSMRIALGKMAREGEPATETLGRVVDQIKNAGSASEANALALELFGARAGPDMAAAIREGRFEVDDLMASLASGGDTIAGAAAETDGFAETFGRLKNKVILAVEPLATKFLGFLEDLLPKLEPIVTAIGERLPGAFAALVDFLRPVGEWLSDIGDQLGAFFTTLSTGFTEDEGTGIEKFALFIRDDVLPIVEKIADFIKANLKPILIGLGIAFAVLISPLGTLVAALVYAYTKSETFRDIVDGVIRFIVNTVVPAIVTVVEGIVDAFSDLVRWTQEHWSSISEAIGHVVVVIQTIIETAVGILMWIWENFGDTILAYAKMVWDNISAIVQFAIDFISGIIEFVLAIINGEWGDAWDAIVGILSAAWDLAKELVGNALEFLKTLISDGFDVVKGLVRGALDGVIQFFRDLPGDLASAAGDVFGFLWDSFKAAINFIIRGWNGLEFKVPGVDAFGIHIGGFTIGVPDIPELAEGADFLRGGLAMVGDEGPELLALPRGASVVPLDVAEMIAGAALEAKTGDGIHLHLQTVPDATADEVIDAANARLGWETAVGRIR